MDWQLCIQSARLSARDVNNHVHRGYARRAPYDVHSLILHGGAEPKGAGGGH